MVLVKLSDHVKIKVTLEGESTGDAELDKLTKAMSDDVIAKFESAARVTGDEADKALAKFFCDSLRETLLDMSDESFNKLLVKFVEELGNKKESA